MTKNKKYVMAKMLIIFYLLSHIFIHLFKNSAFISCMVYKIHITNINVFMSTKTLTHTEERLKERQESENRFEMVFIC